MCEIISSLHLKSYTYFQEEYHSFVRHRVNCGVDLRRSGQLEISRVSSCLWNTPEGSATEAICRKYLDTYLDAGWSKMQDSTMSYWGISAMKVYPCNRSSYASREDVFAIREVITCYSDMVMFYVLFWKKNMNRWNFCFFVFCFCFKWAQLDNSYY